MKIERTRNHFFATFSLPSPSSDLKVPILLETITILTRASLLALVILRKIDKTRRRHGVPGSCAVKVWWQ